MRRKTSLLPQSTAICFFSVWFLSGTSIPQAIEINGLTMGTTYHVSYFDEKRRDFKYSIDSVLILVNKGISVFDSESEVSKFNRSANGIQLTNEFFSETLSRAYHIAVLSGGSFDPTVMPLVNTWGFGTQKFLPPTSRQIDSLKAFVGIDKIVLTSQKVQKKDARVQLDFGGIGQGYGADVVSDFLKSKGIKNFLVEIGGEGYALGKNLSKDHDWVIGILDPNSTEENQFMNIYVSLKNQSFTTSGNYFKKREVNGEIYGHTINPKTGFPVKNEMLSATIFADDCATADAWDNAFMVMGIEKSIVMLKATEGVEAILQYSTPNGLQMYITPGIKDRIVFNN